jgi:hypothetical protein
MFPECDTQVTELTQRMEELRAVREEERDSHYAQVGNVE